MRAWCPGDDLTPKCSFNPRLNTTSAIQLAAAYSVIASEAKQSRPSPRKDSGLLRRFSPRNDGVDEDFWLHARISNRLAGWHTFAFSRHDLPELCSTPSPSLCERAQGRPGAGWHPWPAVRKMREKTAQRKTGEAGNSPAFPAQWFDGLCRALLGDEFLLSPSLRGLTMQVRPGWAVAPPQSLTVATTARTTRFCRTRTFAGSPQGSMLACTRPSKYWRG